MICDLIFTFFALILLTFSVIYYRGYFLRKQESFIEHIAQAHCFFWGHNMLILSLWIYDYIIVNVPNPGDSKLYTNIISWHISLIIVMCSNYKMLSIMKEYQNLVQK